MSRFRALEPPSTLPRLCIMDLLFAADCGAVVRVQSYTEPKVEPLRPGMYILLSLRASKPASMTKMQSFGSAWLRRVATTRPAVPPPTTICEDQSDLQTCSCR